jgi:hypothetical protein
MKEIWQSSDGSSSP